tara:strand:- start:42 stop:794 length:753 start_codon:yes stop_codon:yes gene_type:complete
MGYLRELPNVRYQSPLSHKNSSKDFIIIKNLFRKNKILDWLSETTGVFNKFIVADGARPDNVAEDIYGRADLDYVVIISCGITNLRDEWPLSSKELYEYVENKYGLAGMGEIHHYETLEVRDEKGRLILPAGQVVDSTFKIDGPSTKFNGLGVSWSGGNPSSIGTFDENSQTYQNGSGTTYVGETISPIVGVSNFDYETEKNEKKREIRPLKRQYLQMFLNDFKRIMRYDRNSQYITDRLITTESTDIVT